MLSEQEKKDLLKRAKDVILSEEHLDKLNER